MMLTIAYLTNRKNPRIEWFFDSLALQTKNDFDQMQCVVVDYHAEADGRKQYIGDKSPKGLKLVHVPPKPSVWQGRYRLTQEDYFAASNARNTALCLAPDGWIAYVDDLSVLLPGWLDCVKEAIANNYVALGAYQKVWLLNVVAGKVVMYRDVPTGHDSREPSGSLEKAVSINGGGLFGCSLAAPVKAFLDINGWDEDCDSMGMEDCMAGIMLNRNGYDTRYDLRMKTFESEEAHHEEGKFKRIIKTKPSDASWTMYNMVVYEGRNKALGYHYGGSIAALRDYVLAGNDFPNLSIPQHDWRDGQPISEM